uniref:cGMP-dependent protein kinase 1-like n=1 Tax=Styela clava TaxID=7725 RepID=UPI001939C8F2|nr:cGMP-dependent protein kinase 1-like [Styela clava]
MGSVASTHDSKVTASHQKETTSQASTDDADMDKSKKEMEAIVSRLKTQLERKDAEIVRLSRAAEKAMREYDESKNGQHNVNKTSNRKQTVSVPSLDDEIKELKTQITKLEEIIESKDKQIDDLTIKLHKMRRDKDNQVETVKETVEKVINDKDSEIRRLKALWGVKERDQSEEGTKLLAVKTDKARFGISAENRASKSLHHHVKNFPKTDSEKKSIARALRRNIFLSSLAQSQVKELIECMQKEELEAKCNIIREGDAGTHLYIIEEGEVEVFQEKSNEMTRLAVLTPGCVFGELAILYNCKRTASVRARTGVVLWSLERKSFQSVVQRRGKMIRDEYIKLLQTVDQLRHLPEEKIMRIADCLEEETFKAGEYIIRQGESGDTFYILYDGKVKITKFEDGAKPEDEATFLSYMDRGKFFGERALLREEKRAANVIAYTDVVCLTLDRLAFSSLIGAISEVNLQAQNLDELESKNREETKTKISTIEEVAEEFTDQNITADIKGLTQREKIILQRTTLDNLKVTKLLGKGGFGSVSLVHIPSIPNRAFALKTIKKAFIVKTGQETHVVAERNILMAITSTFIACLHRTYKDDHNIYMLMDAYLGGDIYITIKRKGPLNEEAGRFAIACVIEALAYLHFRCIAYRDLKPENLMIDHNGYVKLVDFGFAKKVKPGNKTWTFCGTPEYFPPEILQNLGHDSSADYWSLGILTFELLTATTPFFAPDDLTVYEKIVDGIERIKFPNEVTKNAELLIRNLCRLDPRSRIGNMSGGVNDIRKHRWFRGFYWEGLRRQLVKSPIKVNISGTNDTSNFENLPVEEDTVNSEEPLDTSSWDQYF